YYNEDLPVLGDWEFYLRFLRRFNIYVLQEQLAYYHQRTVGEGIYSNTIIGQSDKHALYDTLIRNQLLRDDMDTNKVGLGFLVNSAKVFRGYVDDPRQQIEEAKRT